MTGWAGRWQVFGLWLWAGGVQVSEGLSIAGLAITALATWAQRRPTLRALAHGLRAWLPLLAFVGWGLASPFLAGRSPSGTGVARLSDWLALPLATYAFSALTH